MGDNIVAYQTINEVKTIIERSTEEINKTFKSMSDNIAEEYASSGGGALSGSAGAAIARAWENLAAEAVPPMRVELEKLTKEKLAEWAIRFGITEQDINQIFGQ